MKCDKCGNQKITYYKQCRKDGVWVVTARCENGHHPITGKPFYPISQFDIASLPILPGTIQPGQMQLFVEKKPQSITAHPTTLIEIVEQRRRGNDMFPFFKKD